MHYETLVRRSQLCIIKNAFKPNKNQVYLYFLRRSILCIMNFLLPLHSLLKVLPIKFSPSRGVRGGLTIFLTPRMGACA